MTIQLRFPLQVVGRSDNESELAGPVDSGTCAEDLEAAVQKLSCVHGREPARSVVQSRQDAPDGHPRAEHLVAVLLLRMDARLASPAMNNGYNDDNNIESVL